VAGDLAARPAVLRFVAPRACADGVLGGKKVPVHANRGLAGIDGTIATGMGIAIASQAAATSA
jgi:2-succinyl-5-enolpyruvyl-6-hydroxy-3-cyclohexene-1-carboxylate synthase